MYFLIVRLFLWPTNTHFCLGVFQKSLKSAINSESVKITSHPEVLSRPASETRNQSRNKEAVITRVRSSIVHEDIKLIVIKEFRISIPRRHSRGVVRWLGIVVTPKCTGPLVPALALALAVPLIVFTPPRIIIWSLLWLWCLCGPQASFLYIFIKGILCCLKSPDQGFLTFQSPHQLIESSLDRIHLHTSLLCTSSSRRITSKPRTFPCKNKDSLVPLGNKDRDTLVVPLSVDFPLLRYQSRSMGGFPHSNKILVQPNKKKKTVQFDKLRKN